MPQMREGKLLHSYLKVKQLLELRQFHHHRADDGRHLTILIVGT